MNELPKGLIGYAQVTCQPVGDCTTEVDLTGLTVTVTLPRPGGSRMSVQVLIVSIVAGGAVRLQHHRVCDGVHPMGTPDCISVEGYSDTLRTVR